MGDCDIFNHLTFLCASFFVGNENFCLHFNEKNKVMEIVLQAVSKEARYNSNYRYIESIDI